MTSAAYLQLEGYSNGKVVRVNGVDVGWFEDEEPTGRFLGYINLVPGENIITVVAQDEAGNTTTVNVRMTRQ